LVLHYSGVKEYVDDLGLEVFANIDGATNEIYNVDTGFHHELAIGANEGLRSDGGIIWHTNPRGTDVNDGDLRSITDYYSRGKGVKNASWIFASGKRLTGMQNPNFSSTHRTYMKHRGVPKGFESGYKEYSDGLWGTTSITY